MVAVISKPRPDPYPESDLLDFPSGASWKEAYAEDETYGPFLRYLEIPESVTSEQRLKFERWASRFRLLGGLLYLQRPESVDPRC